MGALYFAGGYYLVKVVFALALMVWSGAIVHMSAQGVASPMISTFSLMSVALAALVFGSAGLVARRRVSILVATALGGLCYVMFGALWMLVQLGAPTMPLADCGLCAVFIAAVSVSLLGYGMQATQGRKTGQ